MKLDHFTATLILREIKFWGIQKVKNAILGNFKGSEFACWQI